MTNSRFHLPRSSSFSFSSHNLLLLMSSRTAFFFFLLLTLLSSVFQWHHEEGNSFLEYVQSNWLFSDVFKNFFISTSSSHFIFSFSTSAQSFPNISASISFVPRSMGHKIQYTEYKTCPISYALVTCIHLEIFYLLI